MGIWIGLSLIVLGGILMALELVYLSTKTFNLKLYKVHVITAAVIYISGVVTCILTTESEGVFYAIYTLIMGACGVFVVAMQTKSYRSAVKLKASMDRLNEFFKQGV